MNEQDNTEWMTEAAAIEAWEERDVMRVLTEE